MNQATTEPELFEKLPKIHIKYCNFMEKLKVGMYGLLCGLYAHQMGGYMERHIVYRCNAGLYGSERIEGSRFLNVISRFIS